MARDANFQFVAQNHQALSGCMPVPSPPLENLLADPVLLMVLARNGLAVEKLRELSLSVGERLRRC